MSDVIYRANLKASSFPFLSELFGRSIIVKGPDQASPIGDFAKSTTDASGQGIPQIYYCHNVMPTDSGYKSVGYRAITAAATGTFVDVVQIFDGTGAQANLAITAAGVLWVMESGTTAWVLVGTPPVAGTIAGKVVTVGTVNGVSYIYFSNVGCYTYDFGTGNTTASPLIPGAATFTQADILGVVSNRGYLLAYTTDEVFWSSTIDPLDFDPSLTTGAGGGKVEAVRGIIVVVVSVFGGFIVFTNKNVVAATASDNTRFPYNFSEVTGGGGLTSPDFVSYDANSSSVYAYTTAGIQMVSVRGATSIFPEVTDFISGDLFEDYNETTNILSLTDAAGAVIQKHLVVVGNRYLIISYGISAMTNALVYDTIYKQWGKLKHTHVDCFQWDRTTVESAKNNIALIAADGSIATLDTDINSTNSNGVMMLGKYQYVRTRLMQLQRVALENINAGDTFSLLDLPAADGKNFGTALVGYLATNSGKFREYLFHNTAMNHTMVLKGNWNAVSMVLTFNVTGQR